MFHLILSLSPKVQIIIVVTATLIMLAAAVFSVIGHSAAFYKHGSATPGSIIGIAIMSLSVLALILVENDVIRIQPKSIVATMLIISALLGVGIIMFCGFLQNKKAGKTNAPAPKRTLVIVLSLLLVGALAAVVFLAGQ